MKKNVLIITFGLLTINLCYSQKNTTITKRSET
jgi:hypothetical protein